MSIDFLKTDYDKVSYLVNLLTARATGLSAENSEFERLRQELLRNTRIEPFMPQWLKQHRNLDSFWGFIQPKFKSYAERRTFISEQFTTILDSLEFGDRATPPQASLHFASPFPIPTPTPTNSLQQIARNKRKVFIVHGRDNEAKIEVSRFIEKLGLEAIVLHEQASSGMTIIEKIEKYSNEADFAIVLYTPCDQGRGFHESQNPPNHRARQNVVFEHGYFMAKLGRKNVLALVKGVIEVPNDINGVVYINFDAGGAWKLEASRELRSCGYTLSSSL